MNIIPIALVEYIKNQVFFLINSPYFIMDNKAAVGLLFAVAVISFYKTSNDEAKRRTNKRD